MGGEIEAIVNPASGAGRTSRRWPWLRRQIQAAGWTVRTHVTSGPGDATRISRELLRAGAREILSVGGDGTANEVANGFFIDGQPIAPEAVLSVMPTGTGHDFARSLAIRSTDEAIGMFKDGQVCRIDVGFADYRATGGRETRCFVNAADVGLGAATAARINRSRKLLGGALTYLLGAVRTMFLYRAAHAEVIVDGQTISDGPTEMVLIANGRFHAGGMRMAPMARITDSFFEVLVLKRISKWSLVATLLPRVYSGTHVSHPAIQHARGREVRVRAASAVPFEMDGEQPGTTDLSARVLPQAMSVRAPRPKPSVAGECR